MVESGVAESGGVAECEGVVENWSSESGSGIENGEVAESAAVLACGGVAEDERREGSVEDASIERGDRRVTEGGETSVGEFGGEA